MNVTCFVSYYAIINVAVSIILVVLLAFAIYSQHQRKVILRKNRILARKVELTNHLMNIIKDTATIYTSDLPPITPEKIKKPITEMTDRNETETPADSKPAKKLIKAQLERETQLKLLVEETVKREKLYLHERLSYKELSAATGISQLRLHSLFGEEHTYMNLNEYVNRRFRIPLVLQMFSEHPEYTVEAIARECGYQNMKTFFNWFHREMGMTPREYCKMLDEGQAEEKITPPI